jgi:hypothetical protein
MIRMARSRMGLLGGDDSARGMAGLSWAARPSRQAAASGRTCNADTLSRVYTVEAFLMGLCDGGQSPDRIGVLI